jgi:hypothetical protein
MGHSRATLRPEEGTLAAMDRVPAGQIWLVTAVVLVGGAFSWWTHTGPWAWCTAAQLAVFGDRWWPILNVFGVLGVGLGVGLTPLAVLHRHSPVAPRPDLSWLHRPAGKSALVGAGLLVVALFELGSAMLAGPLVDIDADALTTTDARYVQVSTARAEAELSLQIDDDVFTPVVQGEHIVAVFQNHRFDEGLDPEVSGMFAPMGAPGAALTAWRQAGWTVATDVPVLDTDASPGRSVFIAAFTAAIGAPALLGGLFFLRRDLGAA